MSIDLSIFSAEGIQPGTDIIPTDWEPPPLGSADEVRSALSATFPALSWSDPDWAQLECDGVSASFSLPAQDPIVSVCVFVYPLNSPNWPTAMAELCSVNQWVVIDYEEGILQNRDTAF